MSEVELRGVEDFLALSRALKRAGQSGLRRDLNRGLRQAAKPLIPRVKADLRAKMPQRGGAGRYLAGKRARVAVKTGGDPGVSVVFAKQDPRLDDGRLAHPVFGRRPLVVQRVRAGVFSGALREHGPEVRQDVSQAIDDVLDRVAREVR